MDALDGLLERYAEIRARIHALNPNATLLAVSKRQPVEKIEALYRAGHRDFAENYVQELCEKRDWTERAGLSEIRWHVIGAVQRKKVPKLVSWISSLHSLDRWDLAVELDKRWKGERPLPVFVEVNTSGLQGRAGVTEAGLEAGLEALVEKARALPALRVEGLMTIPDPANALAEFDRLREWSRRLGLPELSMGMSGDFEEALRRGATQVRIGTALFGARY